MNKVLMALRKLARRFICWESYRFFSHSEVLDNDRADNIIIEQIQSKDPCFISRFGSFELECCEQYYFIKRKIKKSYSNDLMHHINVNAGVFPASADFLNSFSECYLRSINSVTVFAIFQKRNMEKYFIKKYSRCRNYISWFSLYPGINSWSTALKGKRVLVVSPFADSIVKQYKIKDQLFQNHNILPAFSLETYKPIVSFGWHGGEQGYQTWKDALDKMFTDIQKFDFDICLLSCGAYGLPLGAMIYTLLKKHVVHVGGSLQLLFGIRGSAYDRLPSVKPLINDKWIYPSQAETPENAIMVEDSCYWSHE